VVYTDLRGHIKQANPRFCQLTGYTEAELLRLSLSDFTHADDMEVDAALMAQLVRGKSRCTADTSATSPCKARPSGSSNRFTAARRQRQAAQHRGRGGRHHRALAPGGGGTRRETAEASNRAKSDFLSRMSHELRTPLNAMLGFAQLLELDPRHALAPSQRPWISQIQQAGWHLLEMINDVLDLSRIESDNLRLQTENLNLVELLDATVAMVQGEARERAS